MDKLKFNGMSRTFILSLLVISLFFWVLRLLYWGGVDEKPFSDIADYVEVARNIVSTFTFGKPPGLLAYFTPVTPSFIAFSILIGGDSFESIYRVMIQILAFTGAIILCVELGKLTNNRWLGLSFLLVVAFNRASIFWSYKLSTEGLSEALLMVVSALALRTFRQKSIVSAFFTGIFGLLLALNRPQYLAPVLLLFVIFFLFGVFSAVKTAHTDHGNDNANVTQRLQRGATLLIAAALGAAIIWSPWIVRNYRIFHEIVPTSTSGLESFLWDTGGGPLLPNTYSSLKLSSGEVVTKFHIRDLQTAARAKGGEMNATRYMSEVGRAWLAENWRQYPALVLSRLEYFITTNGASGLTHVSRDKLFTNPVEGAPVSSGKSILDGILFDKTPIIVWLALVGVVVMFIRAPFAALGLFTIWGLPWLTTALVLKVERAIEPMIPMTIWFALFAVVQLVYLIINAKKT